VNEKMERSVAIQDDQHNYFVELRDGKIAEKKLPSKRIGL